MGWTMALLDDLKAESEKRLRAELEQQRREARTVRQRQEDREYRNRLLPAMTRILTYLSQLSDHLNYIKPATKPRFTIPGHGDLEVRKQIGYRVSVDSHQVLRRITLQFQAIGNTPLQFKVTPLSMANDLDDLLEEHRLDFTITEYRDGYQHLVGRNFEVRPAVPVTVRIEADVESTRICVSFTNFASPSTRRVNYLPEQITDQFLDDLGNYVLRKSDKLTQLEIPAEIRERLRQRMEAEKQQEERPRRSGLLSKIFRGTD
jgi:hypothetical protein